jgi:hypothetical protein
MVLLSRRPSDVTTESPTIMATVWVQLYIGQEKVGRPFGVYDFRGNVDQLTEAVKEKCRADLSNVSANKLNVYPPGTEIPILEGAESLNPWDTVQTDTTGKAPLIVIAPQQQPPAIDPNELNRLVALAQHFNGANVVAPVLPQPQQQQVRVTDLYAYFCTLLSLVLAV